MQSDLFPVLEQLERWGEEREWIGPDPYEGLNSPLARLARSHRSRQAVIQAYKRMPFTPPWPLRTAPRPSAKALALALSGYASRGGRALPGAEHFLDRIPSLLERLNSVRRGAGWGYHFDVHTRSISYSAGTPNAIVTSFVVGALLDASQATGEERYAKLALAARPYLLSLLTESRHGPFFAYVKAGSELIHNANLLVCRTLALLHDLDKDREVPAAVEAAAATTVSLQRDNGLWPYGERDDLQWVDNLHTAYVLDGLVAVSRTFEMGREALRRGLRSWRERFFDPYGAARYYADRRFPLEPHCYASAIDLLCTVAEVAGEEERVEPVAFARRIAQSAVRELWLPDSGRFAYRRTRLGLNRREFMRWTNAPMFRALARLCGFEAPSDGEDAVSQSAARAGTTH